MDGSWFIISETLTMPLHYAMLDAFLQGDGVPPNEARDFCEWLFAGKAGPLSHLSYSVCALGDRSEVVS